MATTVQIYDRRHWPYLDLIRPRLSWEMISPMELKTVRFLAGNGQENFDELCRCTGTLNLLSLCGAAPGTVLLTNWKMDRLTQTIVQYEVELYRRADGHDLHAVSFSFNGQELGQLVSVRLAP